MLRTLQLCYKILWKDIMETTIRFREYNYRLRKPAAGSMHTF